LSEHAAKRALAAYGIGVTREMLVQTAADAVAAGRALGYPVVLKVQSPDIPHKTEAHAVRLGLDSDAAVTAVFDEIMQNARAFKKNARIEGVLVQEMVKGGIETILGVTNDPLFGPAVMFGIGGVFAEVLKDVSFRMAPVTPAVAREMIDEIKGSAVLKGARGAAPADLDALADVIVRVSAMAIDLQDRMAELDINPLFVFPQARGVKAGDALIKPKPAA
jgi:acetyltransferase